MAKAEDPLFPLPPTAEVAVKQAVEAIKRSLAEGQTRQQINLLLPVEQRRDNYMFTESMDYPENASAIYETAGLIATSIIKQLGVTERVESKRIDNDGVDGEPVGLFTTKSNEVIVIMLPTADVLNQLKEIEKNKKDSTVIFMNPMWRTKGNIVSDFGIGPWRKRNEEFVAKFKSVYSLTEQRIGAASTLDPATNDYMGLGGVARILFAYPGPRQVFAIGKDGSSDMLATFPSVPEYKQLEDVFQTSRASLNKTRRADGEESEEQRLETMIQKEKIQTKIQKASEATVDWSLKSGAEINAAIQAGSVGPEDVLVWDKGALRAALGAWNLPQSGNLVTLRGRVIQKMKNPNA